MNRTVLPLLLLSASACRATAPIDPEDSFKAAVESRFRRSPAHAASAAWTFLQTAEPDDPRYDRARLLLAHNLEAMGLSWPAGELYRDVAQERRTMEQLPEALRGVERIVASGTADEDILLTGFVAAEEFGYLPDDVRAFVDYERGLDLVRRGDLEWAGVYLGRIDPESPYAARARYVEAVRLVARHEDEAAIERLDALRDDRAIPADLRLDVERSLARLAFERERFEEALRYYEDLREEAPDDPEILLETAWTHFYLGDSRTTLGLLLALDAPVHGDYIAPERFLLEALALRRLCQFAAARDAAERLREEHGDALDALAAGTLPEQVPELVAAARLRGLTAPNTRYARRLEWERETAWDAGVDDTLRAWLMERYERALAEARRREEERIQRDLYGLTEELLASEEGVRLILHELSVSLLRGRRRPAGVEERQADPIPISGDRAFFPFTGEYWTDEMDDLVVIAEDRCID